jgi:hypothetical protein
LKIITFVKFAKIKLQPYDKVEATVNHGFEPLKLSNCIRKITLVWSIIEVKFTKALVIDT